MERTPLSTSSTDTYIRILAEAFVSGPWREDDLVERGGRVIGRKPRWLRPLVRRLLDAFGREGSRPPTLRVAGWLTRDRRFRKAVGAGDHELSNRRPLAPCLWPAPGRPQSWAVPILTTTGDLAEFLSLDPGALDWFADRQGRTRRSPAGPLRHYRYTWRAKRSGTARLIEAPKSRLKALQRRLLDEILAPIPPHEAAHGFRAGRSIRSFAEPHTGQHVVLKLDLKDFFTTITSARIAALFLAAGYPDPVARLLTGLCTNRTPGEVWNLPGAPGPSADTWRARRLYIQPHLPQGAPTSPALANLMAYRLDARLTGLARAADARYTRYADDLVFSGGANLERSLGRFLVHVGATVIEEGFEINPRKTPGDASRGRSSARGRGRGQRPSQPRPRRIRPPQGHAS